VNLFVMNAVLAFGWSALLGDFTLTNFVVGFVIGYVALWLVRPLFGPTRYFERFWRVLSLTLFFLWELLMSNLRVLWDVITPPIFSRPGILAVPLDAETDVEIMLLANMVSLTPGTLSLEVSDDRRILYVHAMFIDEPENVRRSIKDGLERRILEVTR
jgi:multicomponent Na+:H+ antiporter subunit E